MGSVKRWWRRTEPALQQGAVKFDAKARQVAAKLDEHSGMSPDSIAKSRRLEEHLDAKATDWERQLDTTTMALQRRAGERVRRALSSMESAALAGVASGLLLVLSIYLLRRQPGAHDTSPAELTAWFADSTNRRLVLVGLQLAPFSAIGLLWFIAVIRRRLGEREDQFFASVFLGSGIGFAFLMLVSAVAGAAPTLVVHFSNRSSPDPDTVALGMHCGTGPS